MYSWLFVSVLAFVGTPAGVLDGWINNNADTRAFTASRLSKSEDAGLMYRVQGGLGAALDCTQGFRLWGFQPRLDS